MQLMSCWIQSLYLPFEPETTKQRLWYIYSFSRILSLWTYTPAGDPRDCLLTMRLSSFTTRLLVISPKKVVLLGDNAEQT